MEQSAEKIFGFNEKEALNQNLHHLICPETLYPRHLEAFKHFSKTGKGNAIGKTLELEARTKSGDSIPVELSLSAIQRMINGILSVS